MNIASIGHRSRQDHLSPCCIGRAQQDSAAQKILTLAIAGLHRQSARVVNRSGGRGTIDLHNWLMPRGGSRASAHLCPATVAEAAWN
jgi:hypothetical protein